MRRRRFARAGEVIKEVEVLKEVPVEVVKEVIVEVPKTVVGAGQLELPQPRRAPPHVAASLRLSALPLRRRGGAKGGDTARGGARHSRGAQGHRA